MITLTETQQNIFDKLLKSCEKIESDLAITVSPNYPQEIQNQIENLRPHLSAVPMMLADVNYIHDSAKAQCAEIILAGTTLAKSKSNVQKMWIDGYMIEYNKLFVRVESVTKKLDKSIETLVSLLSFEKEKIKYNIHQV